MDRQLESELITELIKTNRITENGIGDVYVMCCDKSFMQEHLDLCIDSGIRDFPADFMRYSRLNLERFPVSILIDDGQGDHIDVWLSRDTRKPPLVIIDKIATEFPDWMEYISGYFRGKRVTPEMMKKHGLECDITNVNLPYEQAIQRFRAKHYGVHENPYITTIETIKKYPHLACFGTQYQNGSISIEEMLQNKELFRISPDWLSSKDLKFLLRNAARFGYSLDGLTIARNGKARAIRKIISDFALNIKIERERYPKTSDIFGTATFVHYDAEKRYEELKERRIINLKRKYKEYERLICYITLPELTEIIFDFLFKHWRDFITIRID